MDNKQYLDFDEAVHFLKTTPSTLYKWLHAGKIPGHKLGRQWRFLLSELDLHISGKAPQIQMQRDILQFSELLNTRSKTKSEDKMDPQLHMLTEKLIWDAYDHSALLIHIYPTKGKYEISYRIKSGMEKLTIIPEEFFLQLDASLLESSSPVRGNNSRRMYLERNEEDSIQVRYQKVETVTGPRIALRIWQPKRIPTLEKIVEDKSVLNTFHEWLSKNRGIILVSGEIGNGITTSLTAMLQELRKQEKIIFTLENPAELVIEGVNQVELKEQSKAAFEDAYIEITESDPDAICFSMGNFTGMEEILYSTAIRAANAGFLVLLQIYAPSCETALEELQKYSKQNIEHLIVGVSSQKLAKAGGNDTRRAQFALLEPAKKYGKTK